MRLIITLASALAVCSAGQIYSQQGNYQNAEAYQPELEYQHVVYPDQGQVLGQLPAQHTYSNRPLAEKTAKIISYHSENNVHNYNYGYETENGIKAEEVGQTGKGTQAEGAFSYTGDDGHVYTVTYTADENGYRPQGAHLPTPPPIPEAILKSLEQNARDEANGIQDDGQYKSPHQGQVYQQYEAEAYQQNYQIDPAQVAAVEAEYH